jgi:hypothetical protein
MRPIKNTGEHSSPSHQGVKGIPFHSFVELWLDEKEQEALDLLQCHHCNQDLGDRVFYSDRSGRWARKADVFLGLVGDDEEHEGKLRFTQVGEKK